MASEILFYDLSIQSSVRTNKCFAPNALYDHPSFTKHITEVLNYDRTLSTVRYALNYKKLAYKTVWVQFHEIEDFAKKVGAQPTRTKPNG